MAGNNPFPKASSFPTTHWTVINALKQASDETRGLLLTEFLDRYTPAFRLHLIYGRGIVHEQDLEDALQGFITDKFVARNILEHVEQGKGRLRSYFRRCLDHYIFAQHSTLAANAWNARVGWEDQHDAQPKPDDEPCDFDIAWARTVMTEAIIRTKDQFYHSNRQLIWDVFDLRHIRPLFTGQPPLSVSELAERLGMSEKAVHNRRVTALRAFQKHLREIIIEYVGEDEKAVEDEIADLSRIMHSNRFDQDDF